MSHFKIATCYLLGLLFIAAGLNHFLHTDFYISIMPPYLPWPLVLVYISGLAEMALGGLLLIDRCRIWAAWGLIALSLAVFPANIHMARHPDLYPMFSAWGLWFRLPLQALLIAWIYWYTRLPRDQAAGRAITEPN